MTFSEIEYETLEKRYYYKHQTAERFKIYCGRLAEQYYVIVSPFTCKVYHNFANYKKAWENLLQVCEECYTQISEKQFNSKKTLNLEEKK